MSERQKFTQLNIDVDRESFVRDRAVELIETLSEGQKPAWGMMSSRHMVEHLIFITENSMGKRPVSLLIPEEKLPRYKAFLMGNDGFMRNFKFPLLPVDELPDLSYPSLDDAIQAFKKMNNEFLKMVNDVDFKEAPHPFYGSMNREEAIMFQFKHLMHHLMQFDLI